MSTAPLACPSCVAVLALTYTSNCKGKMIFAEIAVTSVHTDKHTVPDSHGNVGKATRRGQGMQGLNTGLPFEEGSLMAR